MWQHGLVDVGGGDILGSRAQSSLHQLLPEKCRVGGIHEVLALSKTLLGNHLPCSTGTTSAKLDVFELLVAIPGGRGR